jgi:hypothetical protein
MSKPLGAEDDAIPSYEESIRSYAPRRNAWQSPLHHQLDDTRVQRVQHILSTYVDPLIAAQGASGLYKTIFVLIPSNVAALQTDTKDASYSQPKEPEVVGFSSNDVVKLVRLAGEEHTMEFWQQPTAMEELATSLRMRMKASGHRMEDQPDLSSTVSIAAPTEPTSSAKKSFWSKPKRKGFFETTVPSEAVVTDQKLGWRGKDEEHNSNKPLARGVVRVRVDWKEICLRMENELGLYENHKGPGIYLSVEVGS